jgi:hypothetical protein
MQERRARHSSRLCSSSSAMPLIGNAAPQRNATADAAQQTQLPITEQQRSVHSRDGLTADATQQVCLWACILVYIRTCIQYIEHFRW